MIVVHPIAETTADKLEMREDLNTVLQSKLMSNQKQKDNGGINTMFPNNKIKVKNVNLEKGVALVSFANTVVNNAMKIEAVDLFGGLRLKHANKLNKDTYVIPSYKLGEWVTYSVEEPLNAAAQ